MGVVDTLTKQKRKLDDISNGDIIAMEKQSKIAKTSSNKQLHLFDQRTTATINLDQGKASSSLAKLLNSDSKKSSIFESLEPSGFTVQQPLLSYQPENPRYQDTSLSSSILGNRQNTAEINTSTTSTAKSKKYKIVTNSPKVIRYL